MSDFEKELDLIKIKTENKYEFKIDLIREMKEQGKELAPLIIPALNHYFGDFTFISSEQDIRHSLEKSFSSLLLNQENKEFKQFYDQTEFHRNNRSYYSDKP